MQVETSATVPGLLSSASDFSGPAVQAAHASDLSGLIPADWPTEVDRAQLSLRPLPSDALALLVHVRAPARLVAHLTVVHEVSCRLVAGIQRAWPRLAFDAGAVAFGAATHDIGKARHPHELSEPGTMHEGAGEQLLLAAGVSPALARFARTHGQLSDAHVLEDLLVMVADKIWKGKRDEAVEERLCAAISEATGAPTWDVFLRLDTLCSAIQKKLVFPGGSAVEWQGQFGVVR